MRIHSGEAPDAPPKGWHRLETQFGPLGVRPLKMDLLKLWGDGIIISRVHYPSMVLFTAMGNDGLHTSQGGITAKIQTSH
jgi:hypothetical protein